MRYEIYEGYMEDLNKKVTRIKNKCKKFGCDFTFEEVGEVWKPIQVHWNPVTQEAKFEDFRYVVVEAEGTALINGWEFIASIDHTQSGNIFRKAMTDEEVEIPERYRTSKPYCEHCNSSRSRKNTFIVRNTENGEFKQVGRNCLCDYTHGLSVECATFMASLRSIFEEEENRGYEAGGGVWKPWYKTTEILQMAAEWIRHYGYQKTTDAYGEYNPDSTKNRVSDIYDISRGIDRKDLEGTRKMLEKVNYDDGSEEAVKTATEAIKWVLENEDNSDYIGNLKVLAKNEYVERRHFGLLCSMIQAYRRDIEKKEKAEREAKENRLSEYIGTIGERIEIEVVNANCVAVWETQFGVTHIYKFKDADGNIAVWKTGNHINTEKVTHIKGTVKTQEKYNGIKETTLTRCKVEERR